MKRMFLLVLAVCFLLFTVSGSLAYNSQGILNNLVSYYTFDTNMTSGSITIDSMNYTNGTGGANVLENKGTPIIGQAVLHAPSAASDATNLLNFTRMAEVAGAATFGVSGWFRFNLSSGANQDAVYMGDTGNDYFFMGYNTNGSFRCAVTTSVGGRTIAYGSVISIGTLTHYVCVYNGVNISIYRDGVHDGSAAKTGTFSFTTTDDVYTGAFPTGGQIFNGSIDELGIWNASLNTSQVALLYNGGAGLAFCSENFAACAAFPAAAVNTVNLSLNNTVNGSVFTNTVTFTNISGTLMFRYYNISGNSFCVEYSGNGTGTNCTAGSSAASTYFDVNVTQVIAGNATIQASSYQAHLNVTATKLYLNTSISTFNVTNDKVFNSTSTSSLMVPANVGANNIQARVLGNFSVNVTCTIASAFANTSCVAAGFYDDLFKINATNSLSGGAISSFDIVAINNSLGGTIFAGSTSNGSVYVPTLQGYNVQFQITSTGYNPANSTQATNSLFNNYSFVLLPASSIFLFFYDEETLNLIDYQNVSVTFQNSTGSFTNISDTGDMIQTELNPDFWTVTVTSTGYSERQFFLTVTGSTAQDIDVYLLNSSQSQDTTFTMKDGTTTDTISGANMTILNNVGGSWVMLEQAISDAFGVTQFELKPNKQYQFFVSATGYVTRMGNFTVTETAYTIILNNANPQEFTSYNDLFTYLTSPSYGGELNNTATNFTVTVSATGGSMDWFAVVVSLNGTNYTQNVTGSPAGGSATQSLDLTAFNGYQVSAFYYMKVDGIAEPLVISRSWPIYGFIPGEYTFSDFMTRYDDDANGLSTVSRGILLTVAAVILGALLGFIFGGAAAVLGAAIVFIAGAFYGWLHWSIVAVVVGGFLLALLIKGVGR